MRSSLRICSIAGFWTQTGPWFQFGKLLLYILAKEIIHYCAPDTRVWILFHKYRQKKRKHTPMCHLCANKHFPCNRVLLMLLCTFSVNSCVRWLLKTDSLLLAFCFFIVFFKTRNDTKDSSIYHMVAKNTFLCLSSIIFFLSGTYLLNEKNNNNNKEKLLSSNEVWTVNVFLFSLLFV